MAPRWPIRIKLAIVIGVTVAMVAVLAVNSFKGAYAYRSLARSVSRRAAELPPANQLAQHVSDLRVTLSKVRRDQEFAAIVGRPVIDSQILKEEFRAGLLHVKDTLGRYTVQLDHSQHSDELNQQIADLKRERETVRKIERSLTLLDELNRDEDWMLNEVKVELLGEELENLHRLAADLPSYLQERMQLLASEVRLQYRAWIVLAWLSTIIAAAMLLGLAVLGWYWVLRPVNVLIRGSRRVAGGDFHYRIQLETKDEMAELARALNDMTDRFQAIRDDLDRQVQLRTKQVVCSERMASVGFLAAGVAHEINNPLQAIAMCAESLQERLHDIIQADDAKDDQQHSSEISVLRNYLRTIEDEAFRCKHITDRLLDFSRMGDVERHDTDLVELVAGVIEMVRHLGRYREKRIEFQPGPSVVAPVNAQEIKQVVLNLITNALDSLDPGGCVRLSVAARDGMAELLVEDDGCGMTPEVLQHLFEPFFTRRRDGSGTGLGLSIAYRIVADHGGEILPHSDGPGCGSRFRMTLPLTRHEQEQKRRNKAA